MNTCDSQLKCSRLVQGLAAAFASGDLDAAEDLVTQLRYLTTAGDAIRQKL